MLLEKETRRRLHRARGAVGFHWPAGPVEPRRGQTYALETERSTTEGRILVLTVDVVKDGWVVTARLAQDPVRYLARGGGYTDYEPRAMMNGRGEPEAEAVDEPTQERITAAVHRGQALGADELSGLIDEALEALKRAGAHPQAKLVRSELWQATGKLGKAKAQLARMPP